MQQPKQLQNDAAPPPKRHQKRSKKQSKGEATGEAEGNRAGSGAKVAQRTRKQRAERGAKAGREGGGPDEGPDDWQEENADPEEDLANQSTTISEMAKQVRPSCSCSCCRHVLVIMLVSADRGIAKAVVESPR